MSSSTFGKGDAFLGTLVLFLREISSPYHDQVEKDGFSFCGCPFFSLAPLYFFSATPFFLAPTVIWGSLNSSGPSCSKPDLAKPGLVEILIVFHLPLKMDFSHD